MNHLDLLSLVVEAAGHVHPPLCQTRGGQVPCCAFQGSTTHGSAHCLGCLPMYQLPASGLQVLHQRPLPSPSCVLPKSPLCPVCVSPPLPIYASVSILTRHLPLPCATSNCYLSPPTVFTPTLDCFLPTAAGTCVYHGVKLQRKSTVTPGPQPLEMCHAYFDLSSAGERTSLFPENSPTPCCPGSWRATSCHFFPLPTCPSHQP